MMRSCLFILCALLLAACAGPAARLQKSEIGYPLETDSSVSAHAATRWNALIVATGNEAGVFGHFVSDFSKALQQTSSLNKLTPMLAIPVDKFPQLLSTDSNIDKAMARLAPREGEGCLVYLTGHGSPAGIALSAMPFKPALPPGRLEKILGRCAGYPTIVVVSACYSGVFMKPGIASKERIVFTAADAQHPSFGCSDDTHYTFYDGCFLDSWKKGGTWQSLAREINACVSRKEAALHAVPSSPQFFFGREMSNLPLPALKVQDSASPIAANQEPPPKP
jgi:Peptidase C13 family